MVCLITVTLLNILYKQLLPFPLQYDWLLYYLKVFEIA